MNLISYQEIDSEVKKSWCLHATFGSDNENHEKIIFLKSIKEHLFDAQESLEMNNNDF